MRRGLVFGKFYPFHVGHQALIEFALTQCDELRVLVCRSEQELIPLSRRMAWLQRTYAMDPRVVVDGMEYREDDLPNTSESNEEVSKKWSEIFLSRLPPIDVVITGEPYGDYVANFMGCAHARFPGEKEISASMIRNHPERFWDSLGQESRRDLLLKVVIAGTESTGKSTLCRFLADYFQSECVREAGRELIQESSECTHDDLEMVAERHAELIREGELRASRLLFIDTDVFTTMSYSEFLLGQGLRVSDEVVEANRADLHLYLAADAPYVQDGTRLNEDLRNALDLSHRSVLDREGIQYVELHGSWERKYDDAISHVDALIRERMPWVSNLRAPPIPHLADDAFSPDWESCRENRGRGIRL